MHHAGRNGEHSCVPFNLSNTSCGSMLKEVDWGGKHPINSVVDWQRHETYPTGHNISEVDWGALHDSSFFLFLVNIDYDAKPKDFFTQEWGVPFNLSNTSCGSMLKEVDCRGEHPINPVVDWQRHETYPTAHNISEVDWGALHDSSFFLFLVNIDNDAKPKDFFTQELWGGLSERTTSTTLKSLNHVEGNWYII